MPSNENQITAHQEYTDSWSPEELRETLADALPTLPDTNEETAGLEYSARKLSSTLVELTLSGTENLNDASIPTVVLLTENWRKIGDNRSYTYHPDVDEGSCQIQGRLFIASTNFSAACATELETSDLGEIFKHLEQDDELKSLPALVLNPHTSTPKITLYEYGLSKPDKKTTYPIYLAELDQDLLDEVLSGFWAQVICSPGGGRPCPTLWSDAKSFKPVSKPEKAIQAELLKSLKIAFGGRRFVIKDEEVVETGRLDIRISGPAGVDEFAYVNHAILEIKVLSGGNKKLPFTDTKTLKKQIRDGVIQAASYRDPPEPCRIAILLCYDMRYSCGNRGESCLEHVRKFAKKHDVALRRWPLFPSSKHLREFRKLEHVS